MRSLCLAASLLSVASAVDIRAWRNDECANYPGQPPVYTCSHIPSYSCCEFPDNIVGRIMSVYVGIFTLPGGVGIWHNEGSETACGREMDSDGDPHEVCLTDIGSNLYPGYGGGGSWFPIPPGGDPSKSRTGSLIPAFKAPPGFANIRPAGSGFGFKQRRSTSLEGRERERRDEEGAMSIEEWQHMIDTIPRLPCNGTRLADLFSWEDGTKGVWVLENPTRDQYDKLSTFPSTTNDTVYNGYLAKVGAVHYDDYSDHDGALYLMDLVSGKEEVTKTISGVSPTDVPSSVATASAH
ncbi:hypothetical protein P7C71_g4213, partial [Lecanoromycetidae sp. Uapishka_2]